MYVLLVLPVKVIHSVGDFTGERLDLRRVRLAGLLSVLIGIAAVVWLGWQGVLGLNSVVGGSAGHGAVSRLAPGAEDNRWG